MTTPPLNTLTAGPMLRLMLAMDGMEPPLPGRRSWKVFKAFLSLPSSSDADVASFQSTWIREDPAEPTFLVRFVRELTDDVGYTGQRRTRIVEIQFLYQLSDELPLAARELWSDDFDSMQGFTEAVEAAPEWKFVVDEGPPTGDVLEDEEPADSVA
jgi:hypothetical protein